jgi:hypothetical protein
MSVYSQNKDFFEWMAITQWHDIQEKCTSILWQYSCRQGSQECNQSLAPCDIFLIMSMMTTLEAYRGCCSSSRGFCGLGHNLLLNSLNSSYEMIPLGSNSQNYLGTVPGAPDVDFVVAEQSSDTVAASFHTAKVRWGQKITCPGQWHQ